MSLCEWYANREILITGVTSELGRALLEKILRSFPSVKVYLVLRSKVSSTKKDRIKSIFASPGYERLRQKQPDAAKRVTLLEGNLQYENLGLSNENVSLLRKVSVAFHAAGPISDVLEFCRKLPSLKAFVAVSTIFLKKDQILENLQNELKPENVPLALVRFAVIGPAYQEPMPGYFEILRGPTALMIGAGRGLGVPDLNAEMIPIDFAINLLIAAAWDRGTGEKEDSPLVYNALTIGCNWGDLIANSDRAMKNFPYPTFGIRGMSSNESFYKIIVFFLEWLPTVICDKFLETFGFKSRIFPQYDRVRNALQSLESISSRAWPVERRRVYQLEDRLSPEDLEAFPLRPEIDIERYALCTAAAAREHCVKNCEPIVVKIASAVFLAILILLFVIGYIFRSENRA